MRRSISLLAIIVAPLLSLETAQAEPANVLLANGIVRSGTVTVRISAWTKEPVITVHTPTNRLYQYAARQVTEVTAQMKVILREQTDLRAKPSSDSSAVLRVEKANQVTILAQSDEWVRVRVWGNHEGWVEERRLGDRVIFSKPD
jgi:uncharacterized protein YgiM (DUF1202 family)